MQGDVTRVITFQLARETSNRTYPEIGVSDPHHPLTHHGNDPEKIARMAKINAFHVSLFAYYLEKLKSTPEGDGSLLDHGLFLYGSGMGNPNVHDHVNLPILVAGGAAGRQKGGRHIRYAEPTPLANLHLTLLEQAPGSGSTRSPTAAARSTSCSHSSKESRAASTRHDTDTPHRAGRDLPDAGPRVSSSGQSIVVGSGSSTSRGAASAGHALADAAEKTDRARVRTLLKQRADVNAAQADGMTALHWAVYHDDLESWRSS